MGRGGKSGGRAYTYARVRGPGGPGPPPLPHGGTSAPGTLQYGRKTAPVGFKTALEDANMALDWRKTAPRVPSAFKTPPRGPKRLRRGSKRSKSP